MNGDPGKGPEPGKMSAAFLVPGPLHVRRGFLGAENNARVLAEALNHRAEFVPSEIWRGNDGEVDETERISSILQLSPEAHEIIRSHVSAALPEVNNALGLGDFSPSHYEIEMAVHGHGAFFRKHIDTLISGSKPTPGRRRHVSAVYYFCNVPPAFSGGAFRLHSVGGNGEPGTYEDIQPENDLMVFFPSWLPHEVMPVNCPSGRFEDGRFAVNCWLYRD